MLYYIFKTCNIPSPTVVVSTNSHREQQRRIEGQGRRTEGQQRRIEGQQRRIDDHCRYIEELVPWTKLISERVLGLWRECAMDREEGEEGSVQGI